MAWVFETKPTATLKATAPLLSKTISIPGITSGTITADNAVTQSNKILDTITGYPIQADENMTREFKQGVEEQ